MRIVLAVAALLVATVPVVAQATDLRVHYLVDGKLFKQAVEGTSLTFTLYSDSACTVASGAPQLVAIENVGIVSKLKLAKTGPTKPPQTVELAHTLTGITPDSALYLTVTGTGITAVGGNCQLQLVNEFPSTLPSGKTLRGLFNIEYTASGFSSFGGDGISYNVPLDFEPTRVFRPQASMPTATCPGTVASPEAAPGYLCVYEWERQNIAGVLLFHLSGLPATSRLGFALQAQSNAAGFVYSAGTWAVTAQ